MSSDIIKVATKGRATIPKELREEFGIMTPGRVVMNATEEGINTGCLNFVDSYT